MFNMAIAGRFLSEVYMYYRKIGTFKSTRASVVDTGNKRQTEPSSGVTRVGQFQQNNGSSARKKMDIAFLNWASNLSAKEQTLSCYWLNVFFTAPPSPAARRPR